MFASTTVSVVLRPAADVGGGQPQSIDPIGDGGGVEAVKHAADRARCRGERDEGVRAERRLLEDPGVEVGVADRAAQVDRRSSAARRSSRCRTTRPGAARSFGSRTLRTAVGAADEAIGVGRGGGDGETARRLWDVRRTPVAVERERLSGDRTVRLVIGAKLEAATCTMTGESGTPGKLGVSSTSTCGGTGLSVALSTAGCVTDSSPSLTENCTAKSPVCVGPGVHANLPVCASSVAPSGMPLAE